MKVQLLLAVLVISATSADLPVFDFQGVDTNVQVQTFPAADLSTLQESSTDSASTNQNIQNAIDNARSTNIQSVKSIDSLFSRLPSMAEIDQIILSADSVAILKTIQTLVSNDSIPCEDIVAYLFEMLGRIRAAIEKKQFAADQLRIIIDAAEAEIARLNEEIARLEAERVDLWLDEYRDRLRELVAELEPLYKQFNEVESQIAPNEARVEGYKKEISILQKSNDDERNRIANDRLKLTETEARIRQLQNELQAAQESQAALEASIARSQALIAENDQKIADARAAIDEIEATIRTLRDQADALRAKMTEIEIQVERIRTELTIAQTKDDQLAAEIAALKNRIALEEQKLVNGDLDSLLDMVATLERILPTVQMEIDRQYYFCYGDGAVETTNTGGVLVYIVRGESFAEYIQSAYGQTVNVNRNGVRGVNELYAVDIFSNAYSSNYGAPFSSNFGSGNSYASDFNCLNPSALQSGQGTIQAISGNQITITHNGSAQTLNLGACTRIEATSRVPQVGQTAVFKGVPSYAGGYNVYAMACL